MSTNRIISAMTLAGVCLSVSVVGQSPVSAAVVGKWTFNETGTVAHDVSGVGAAANGTLVGGATLTGDGYLMLDGTSGYVNYGVPSKFTSIPGGFTIEAWVLGVDTPTQGHEPLLFGQDPSVFGATMYRGVFYGYVGGGGNNVAGAYFNPQSPFLLTVTYDQQSNTLVLYRNGVETTVKTLSLPSFNGSSSYDLLTGVDSTLTQFLSGKIDEITFYDNALTGEQVAADFATGPSSVPVPEPVSVSLIALGATAALTARRRRS